MTIEQKSPYNDFLVECERAFAFLVREYGFVGPEVDSLAPGLLFVIYRKGQVGIECAFEERDNDVSVRIIRLKNGNRPTAYRKDNTGIVVREYLTQLLLKRGIRDLGFAEPAVENGMSRERTMYRKALEGYARMLRDYAQDVLAGSDHILNSVK